MYQKRHKPVHHSTAPPKKDKEHTTKKTSHKGGKDSASNLSRCDSASNRSQSFTPNTLRSNRKKSNERGGTSKAADLKDATICSMADRAYNKDGDEICKWVKLSTMKSIYGHGIELKFVKLLFLVLKKHIERFIEHKNIQAKCQMTAS